MRTQGKSCGLLGLLTAGALSILHLNCYKEIGVHTAGNIPLQESNRVYKKPASEASLLLAKKQTAPDKINNNSAIRFVYGNATSEVPDELADIDTNTSVYGLDYVTKLNTEETDIRGHKLDSYFAFGIRHNQHNNHIFVPGFIDENVKSYSTGVRAGAGVSYFPMKSYPNLTLNAEAGVSYFWTEDKDEDAGWKADFTLGVKF